MNDQGEFIGSFLPQDMSIYYKLLDLDESLTKDFLIAFYEQYDTTKILENWWKEDTKFVKISTSKYAISSLREPYMYAMILMCRLYGERDCSQFEEAFLHLAYYVVMWGKSFNWGGVLYK